MLHSVQHANPPKHKADARADTAPCAGDCTEENIAGDDPDSREPGDDENICGTGAGIVAGKIGSASRAGEGMNGGDQAVAAEPSTRDSQ